MKNKIYNNLIELMMLPGLSGHEKNVCNYISHKLKELGLNPKTDILGNLWVSFPGEGPKVMLFTHMDQIGFIVRKIEKNGFIRIWCENFDRNFEASKDWIESLNVDASSKEYMDWINSEAYK